MKTGIMKPVTSGCVVRDGIRVSEDAELLAYGAGLDTLPAEATPYLFTAPVAPSVAAEERGAGSTWKRSLPTTPRWRRQHDFMVVEGAGGLMVPLAGGLLVADLVRTARTAGHRGGPARSRHRQPYPSHLFRGPADGAFRHRGHHLRLPGPARRGGGVCPAPHRFPLRGAAPRRLPPDR